MIDNKNILNDVNNQVIDKNENEEFKKYYNDFINKTLNKTFSDFHICEKNGKQVFSIDKNNKFDYFILKKLNKSLKLIYKVKQNNRNNIILQIKQILKSEYNKFYICRTDIKNFYESINTQKIINYINESLFVKQSDKQILEKLFKKLNTQSSSVLKSRLPRGINISSTLSELFMKQFDNKIIKSNNVYYFARFVDDIIIFSNTEISINDEFNTVIIGNEEIKLEDGLFFNKEKTSTHCFNNNTFNQIEIDYLGYKFILCKNKQLIIKISDKKLKKIKQKIVISLIDYKRTKDFSLLYNRLLFLSCAYKQKHHLNSGILWNYNLLDDNSESLINLDNFLKQQLKIYNSNFSKENLIILQNISFVSSFKNKIYKYFKKKLISLIIKCWQNV